MTSEHLGEQIRKQSFLRSPVFWVGVATIVGLVITVIGLGIDIVGPKQPKPGLTFEIVGDTDVLDVHRPLQDLSISFRGEDVQERDLNLRILTIKVVNSGEANILLTHYDNEDDWGLRVNGAEVVEARLTDTSSDYLESKVVPQVSDQDTVEFPRIIFEVDEFFAIEVLLLHPKGQVVSVAQVGKIAGVDQASILTRPLANEEIGFAEKTFQGSALTQVVRALTYSVALFIVILGSMLVLIVIILGATSRKERKRREQVLQTRTIQEMDRNRVRDYLIAEYEMKGENRLNLLQSLGKDPTLLTWITPPGHWELQSGEDEDSLYIRRIYDDSEYAEPMSGKMSGNMLRELSELGLLTRGVNDIAIIDPLFVQMVDELLAELR